jgi:hypothetical protein
MQQDLRAVRGEPANLRPLGLRSQRSTFGEKAMLIKNDGRHYTTLIADLVKIRAVKTYLEIGVFQGANLESVHCDVAIGVDLQFTLKHNVMVGKKELHLYQSPSDAFFDSGRLKNLAPNGLDMAFLDGMHLFEFLLRDFYKTEKHCRSNSLVLMHDCLPSEAAWTSRSQLTGAWTGDVWKMIPILKKYRPDLGVKAVNASPSGVLFVSNLDPSSTLLEKKYLEIVSEFKGVESSEENIRAAYDLIEIVGEEEATNIRNHTLHFAI